MEMTSREKNSDRVHLINALLLTILVGGSLAVFPDLPERYASHFRMDGTPDRWATKGLLGWMALPLIAIATSVMQYAMAAYMPRRPGWLNIPQKERLLALPPERQQPVLRIGSSMLFWTTTMILSLFLMIQYSMYRGAVSGTGGQGLMLVVLIYSLVVMPVVMWSFIGRMQTELERQHREQRLGMSSPA